MPRTTSTPPFLSPNERFRGTGDHKQDHTPQYPVCSLQIWDTCLGKWKQFSWKWIRFWSNKGITFTKKETNETNKKIALEYGLGKETFSHQRTNKNPSKTAEAANATRIHNDEIVETWNILEQEASRIITFCRSRSMLMNETSIGKFGVDTAENKPI